MSAFARAEDGDASGEVGEIHGCELAQSVNDRSNGLVIDTQHDDACVSSWWVAPDVTDPTFKGDDQSLDRSCCFGHGRIIPTGEALVFDRVNIVACSRENSDRATRKVLIELDPHLEATAGYSSRASSAPCATAALIPATVNVG
jgi:hypothetical protein